MWRFSGFFFHMLLRWENNEFCLFLIQFQDVAVHTILFISLALKSFSIECHWDNDEVVFDNADDDADGGDGVVDNDDYADDDTQNVHNVWNVIHMKIVLKMFL